VNANLPQMTDLTEQNVNATLSALRERNVLDRLYRVDIDPPAKQLAANLMLLSDQVEATDQLVTTDFSVVDQNLAVMGGNLAAINSQIDGLIAGINSLEQVSGQLRSLDSLSNNNLDQVSQDTLALSQNVEAINQQIDSLVVAASQLQVLSD